MSVGYTAVTDLQSVVTVNGLKGTAVQLAVAVVQSAVTVFQLAADLLTNLLSDQLAVQHS